MSLNATYETICKGFAFLEKSVLQILEVISIFYVCYK